MTEDTEHKLLEQMSYRSRVQLAEDLREWGAVARSCRYDEMESFIGQKRLRRLRAWIRLYGAADPMQPIPKIVQTPKRPGGVVHMVVGDCHAAPGQDLERFRWLGQMVKDINPDVLVQIGDWYSLDSLCEHRTIGERANERTASDVLAGQAALQVFEEAAKGWAGRKVITLGNHDDRLQDLSEGAPWLEGLVRISDAHRAAGWEVHEFLQPCRIDGILYQHYLRQAGGQRAISGKFHSLRLLERVKFGESVVVGHSHRFQHRVEARGLRRVHGLVAGCYFTHEEDYAGEDNSEWWRGVVVLRDVTDGDFDMEMWSIDRIRRTYG